MSKIDKEETVARQWKDTSLWFTDEQMKTLKRHGKERHFPRGAAIIQEGETGTTFYQVTEGKVVIVKQVHGGAEVTVELSEGNLFGEAVLIEAGEFRSATVRARTDVTVVEFDGPGVMAECDRDRDFAAKLYKMLCRVLRGYLGSTTVALAQAKSDLKAADTRVDDDLRRMAADLKRRMAKDAAPRV